MPIKTTTGDLLKAEVEALVNPVNTVGVMGKGLALQFKKKFPDVFYDYYQACSSGDVVVGKMHVVHRTTDPMYVFNFPTKQHWRNPSRMEYIEEGLTDLVNQVDSLGIKSIAIPPLGCGYGGGLPWSGVRPLIENAFYSFSDLLVLIFE